MLAAQVFVLRSCVLQTQNAGKKFKFKIRMQAERGSADLNFNFTLKLSAAKAVGIKAGAGKDEIVKVENWENRHPSFGFNPDRSLTPFIFLLLSSLTVE